MTPPWTQQSIKLVPQKRGIFNRYLFLASFFVGLNGEFQFLVYRTGVSLCPFGLISHYHISGGHVGHFSIFLKIFQNTSDNSHSLPSLQSCPRANGCSCRKQFRKSSAPDPPVKVHFIQKVTYECIKYSGGGLKNLRKSVDFCRKMPYTEL